tara:strand:- start:2091 stop:2303 length:213 start_codon:yes stop_codon:yes gene_type:complete
MKIENFNDIMKQCFGSRLINIPFEEEVKKETCDLCEEEKDEDHVCYTCCGDEITGIIADIRICPTCKEHI